MKTRPESLNPLDSDYIHENIVQLRRYLGLSQKVFVASLLSDDKHMPLISAGTYSNVEHGDGPSAKKAARLIAEKLSVDVKLFELNPDSFAKNLSMIVQKYQHSVSSTGLLNTAPLPKKAGYTESLVRIISDYLTDGLMSGEIRPRDKLPSDRDLAQRFQVSRSTVREALQVISLIGLIEIRPGQGSFVASDSSDFFLAPLSWSFLIGQKSVADMISIRNLLEVGTAKMAAESATEENLEELSSMIEELKAAYADYDFKAFLELDMTFHLLVAKCAQNPIIYDLLRTARKLLTLISQSGMSTVSDLDNIYQEHLSIYEAILKRDGGLAAETMRIHLDRSRGRYIMSE